MPGQVMVEQQVGDGRYLDWAQQLLRAGRGALTDLGKGDDILDDILQACQQRYTSGSACQSGSWPPCMPSSTAHTLPNSTKLRLFLAAVMSSLRRLSSWLSVTVLSSYSRGSRVSRRSSLSLSSSISSCDRGPQTALMDTAK